MIHASFFPILLIALNYAAAIAYLLERNIPRAVYWACAGTLNLTITFYIKH